MLGALVGDIQGHVMLGALVGIQGTCNARCTGR